MHVVFALNPGGMEFGVVKLVNGLDPRLVESSICSTRPGALKRFVSRRVPVFELQRRDGNDVRTVWQLYRLFRRVRPDVVHTHGWGTLVEGLAAARLARVRAVVHGEHGTLQLKAHQRWIQRRAWAWADQVLSVSRRLSERMADETGFPLARIQTIQNGVDLSRFGQVDRATARDDLGVSAGDLVVGTVGRLAAVKGHAFLIEAIGQVRRAGLQPVLLIAGDGPLRVALEQQAAAAGLQEQVRLLGHRPDVERVLAALDVFALPSLSEGLPNTVLEAMATGLPIVAANVGGVDELVTDGVTGRLVPRASPSALAECITALAESAALRGALGAAARRRVEAEFALSRALRRYELLYRRLVRTGRAAATRV